MRQRRGKGCSGRLGEPGRLRKRQGAVIYRWWSDGAPGSSSDVSIAMCMCSQQSVSAAVPAWPARSRSRGAGARVCYAPITFKREQSDPGGPDRKNEYTTRQYTCITTAGARGLVAPQVCYDERSGASMRMSQTTPLPMRLPCSIRSTATAAASASALGWPISRSKSTQRCIASIARAVSPSRT